MAGQEYPYAGYWSRIYALPYNHYFLDRVKEHRGRLQNIEGAALALREEFKLPEGFERAICSFIRSDDPSHLLNWSPLLYMGRVSLVAPDDMEELELYITGVNSLTTEEEWLALWKRIRLYFTDVALDLEPKGRREGRGRALQEQMKRYSEWYELSERQGLGPKKALDTWESNHPECRGLYDPSTVTKAIVKFKNLIKPRQSPTEL